MTRRSMVEGLTPQQEAFLKKSKQGNAQTSKQDSKEADLETFTVRLPREVVAGVRRVVFKRKLAGEESVSQQAVVREVLVKWLKQEGEA
jgi:hypothetical protein